MFSQSERAEIIALMKREIIPAIGCTEPVAVALCVARATEELGSLPESEMAQVCAFDALPPNLTYPAITPVLFARLKRERAEHA